MSCDFNAIQIPKKRISKMRVMSIITEDYKEAREIVEEIEHLVYDAIRDCYTKKIVKTPKTVFESILFDYTLRDEEGNVIGSHRASKQITHEVEKVVNILDENGNLQWEDDVDENGAILYEEPYKMRYLSIDGIIITKEEYEMRKGIGETAYRAAFIGCTYHCG